MTQDTRKDRRVKIVSLNVRYKSATVDEFIENHAHDVSRGGIYIKTGSPFPPGTLLKFEIRLASDQAVITGVGRVVWKRDTTQGTGERPSGMGVKFIKIDDPSKTVIDKLVNSRADAGQAYESESETPAIEAPAAAAGPGKTAPPPNRNIGKSTMLGMGALAGGGGTPSGRTTSPSAPPRPQASGSTGGAMFPKTNSEADMPPKQEQTVMKQAAELLEEALREAGGSMEDVGTNPLFAGSPAEKTPDASPPPATAPQGPRAGSEPPSSPRTSTDIEAARARAIIAGMSPASVAPPRKATTDPPRTTRDSPLAKGPSRDEAKPASVRPSGRVSIASAPPRPAKKKGGSGVVFLFLVVAAAAFVGVMYRDTLFGSTPAPVVAAPPPALPSASAAATPAPSASEAPSAVASAGPVVSASTDAAVAQLADAAAAHSGADASSAAASATAAIVTPHPVGPHPAAPHPVTPGTTATPTSDTPAATAAPVTTATATSTATSTPTATASPPAKPKPAAKPADDNPY